MTPMHSMHSYIHGADAFPRVQHRSLLRFLKREALQQWVADHFRKHTWVAKGRGVDRCIYAPTLYDEVALVIGAVSASLSR